MNLIVWLFVGVFIGWVASKMMRIDAQRAIFGNMVIGIVGAMIGGIVIAPLVGLGAISQRSFSVGALFVAFSCGVILLGVATLIGRGRVR